MYTNEYEIDMYLNRYNPHTQTNLYRGAVTLWRLAQWANDNSDGWAYWKTPSRASAGLQKLLYDNARSTEDVTKHDLDLRLRAIKAMLTRQSVGPEVKAWILLDEKR